MGDGASDLPPEMRLFIQTPVAQPFVQGRNIGLAGAAIAATLALAGFRWIGFSGIVSFAIALFVGGVNATVVLLRFNGHASTPLAVNINHPFMDDDPMGDAALLIRLSDGSWRDPGEHRVRIIPDELLGGFSLAQDTEDFPVLGHFHEGKERTPTLKRHMTLINQAIALRDAVNEVPDPIEGARERESHDTGLLERSWLEDEKELEVESPLVSFFTNKE